MKKTFYIFQILAVAVAFTSCDKDNDHVDDNAVMDMELRAEALGFTNVEAYRTSVAEQCAAGDHENCDIFTNGTHKACAYSGHAGRNHNGTHHNGTDHGSHDANGHSHGSHGGYDDGSHHNK